MAFCKYHPLSAAAYECQICQIFSCELCVNNSPLERDARCYLCEQKVERKIAASHLTPFWRRLQESFRYPMNKSSLTLIISVAVLTPIVFYLPFAFIFYLALMGTLFKYGFSCLKNTAEGNLTAPDLNEAYQGGLGIAGKLIFMIFMMIATVYGCYQLLGPVFGDVVGIIMVIGFPAILIGFGLTEDIFEAVNPMNMFRLITTVGLPYGLLLAFIMIMSGSVGVINELIGDSLAVVSTVLQSIVLNYYLIVIMHIMGYMIFQYHNELGFLSDTDGLVCDVQKTDKEELMAKIQVHLKEGFYQEVNKLFILGLKSHVNDKDIYKGYFDFLIAIKDPIQLNLFASKYFNFLQVSNQHDRITNTYKQILSINLKYIPETAELRYLLAKYCRQNGEPKLAINLLNGFYKVYPDFEFLVEVYQLLAESFEDLHNQTEQALKCRQFVEKLKSRKPSQKNTKMHDEKVQETLLQHKPKAVFSSIDQSFSAINHTTEQDPQEANKQDDDPRKKDLPPLDFY